MKQQELFNNTLGRLKSDPLNRVTVFNADALKKIVCNHTAAQLEKEYGSVEDFFESIYKSGVKRIQITDRRSHGSTNITVGESYFFDFLPLDGSAVEPKAAVYDQARAPIMPVLNGVPFDAMNSGLNGGLNAAIYQQMDYHRVVPELTAAKAKIERLEADNKRMELELAIINKLDEKSVAQTEANAKLFDSLSPVLTGIADRIFAAKPAEAVVQGLTGANFSEVKKEALAFINSLTDNEVTYMNLLMGHIDNDDVANDLIGLFKKHKIMKA